MASLANGWIVSFPDSKHESLGMRLDLTSGACAVSSAGNASGESGRISQICTDDTLIPMLCEATSSEETATASPENHWRARVGQRCPRVTPERRGRLARAAPRWTRTAAMTLWIRSPRPPKIESVSPTLRRRWLGYGKKWCVVVGFRARASAAV